MTPTNTLAQYDAVIQECRALLAAKNADYKDSWRVMRFTSILDQIKVKACRIDQLVSGHDPRISEGVESELRDILNYAALAAILWDESHDQ
jgi:hypothetical protein